MANTCYAAGVTKARSRNNRAGGGHSLGAMAIQKNAILNAFHSDDSQG